jgi:hypothetical protein
MKPYRCSICDRWIVREASTNGKKASAGDHDPGPHVRRAYGT